MLDGDVLQQPTIPVVNDTNMKKNATMKRAIIARDISKRKTYFDTSLKTNRTPNDITITICLYF